MEFFDAYEEVYSAIERFVEEHSSVPARVNVSPTLFRWLLELKKEAVTEHADESPETNVVTTRFGPIPLCIDELLTPYEIIVE